MKVLLLAGGFGTRISEESILKPKPMTEIGAKPMNVNFDFSEGSHKLKKTYQENKNTLFLGSRIRLIKCY